MSFYEDGLNAVRDKILGTYLPGLDLEADKHTKVLIRKLPKVGEQLDDVPRIFVCPDDVPERVEPLDFEGTVLITYAIEVVTVAANDADYSSNLGTYLDWRERIRKQLMYLDPPAGFHRQRVEPGRPLDRGKVSEMYDYLTLTIRLQKIERK